MDNKYMHLDCVEKVTKTTHVLAPFDLVRDYCACSICGRSFTDMDCIIEEILDSNEIKD